MSDFQIRRDRHYDLMSMANAELRGVIEGASQQYDIGRITAEHALADIRAKAESTAAAIEASWRELLGGAS